MERCERCEKFFDIKQDQGDYVYYRSENDQIAHTFCNACLDITDGNEWQPTRLKVQDGEPALMHQCDDCKPESEEK